jgi:Rod binding domain-containing protein
MDVSTLSVPVDLLKATPTLPVASAATRAKIDASAKQFESQFLSVMVGQMFEGTDVSAPFGGGDGEAAFKSFLTDAMAKSIGKQGGIGLAKSVSKEMLKLQGLS